MTKILMCRPVHFEVSYDINPWMTSQIGKVNSSQALAEWSELVDAISRVAVVKLIDDVSGLPDMAFTANAGFVKNNTVVVSKFRNKERTGEEAFFLDWFKKEYYNIVQTLHCYEGEGDHLIDAFNRHWLGSGFRTDPAVAVELDTLLNINIIVLELVDHRWYHLDTCFCPLPNGEIMWYPPAFSEASQEIIRKSFTDRIEVNEADALLFCCNCVCIQNNLYLPKHTEIAKQLTYWGYKVNEFSLTEFIKAGGSAKCLTLILTHN